MLRTVFSRRGAILLSLLAASWVLFALQAARVPLLTQRIATLEHENRQIDTLTVALSRMHSRYDRIRQILGAVNPSAAGGATSTASPIAAPRDASPDSTPRPAIAAP